MKNNMVSSIPDPFSYIGLNAIDMAILYSIFAEEGHNMAQEGIEELYRRQLVSLTRQAGTSIRKEELKRQALSASVNLPGLIAVQKALAEAIRIVSPTEFRHELQGMTSDDLAKHFMDWLGRILIAAPNLPISRLQNTLQSLNSYIKVHNQIVRDLASEKVYVADIPELTVPSAYIDCVIMLPQALDTANRVVGTFRGIAEVE